ncbi:nsp1a [Passerine astrovirus 1]|nr:nsp1a [Passerine astrovirus 1]
MAFSSLQKRWDRMATVPAGLSRIAPYGSLKLYDTMREKYGRTANWQKLLSCDAIALASANQAYGVKDGMHFQFEATKKGEGWEITFLPTEAIPSEAKVVLAAHASHALRTRMLSNQSSERALSNLKLTADLDIARRRIIELEKEVTTLQNAMKGEKRSANLALRLNAMTVFAVVVLVLALFVAPSRASVVTDCTKPVFGCYVDTMKAPTGERSFQVLNQLCFGETTTRLAAKDVNLTLLMEQCVQDMELALLTQAEWSEAWCRTLLQNRLKPAMCLEKNWAQVIDDKLAELVGAWYTKLFTETFDTVTITGKLAQLVSVAALFTEPNAIYLIPYLCVVMITGTPLFMAVLATTFLTLETNLAYLLLILLPAHHHFHVHFFHMVVTITWTALKKKDLQQLSIAVLNVLILPAHYFLTRLVRDYNIGPGVQLVVFVITAMISTGTAYAHTTVTLTQPDGSVHKLRRLDLFKAGLRDKLTTLQNAVRGVIPEIPNKALAIAIVRTPESEGVCFRFMNYLLTAGHVVGANKTVEICWNGQTAITSVVKEEELFEAADTLVWLKLPPLATTMKPLRLSKLEASDYLQLLIFQNGEPATATGWAIFDGNWLSTPFQTKAGDSGAPYVDRHGRLVGIHLGTQGVVSAGYNLLKHLSPHIQKTPDLQPLNEQPVLEKPSPSLEEMMRQISQLSKEIKAKDLLKPECIRLDDQVVEALVARVCDGTKRSHAALLSKVEQLTERIRHLESENLKLGTALEHMLSAMEANPALVKEEKKPFSTMKILTDEEYNRLMDEGWSEEEIRDAVSQLRKAAWEQYQMERDEEEAILGLESKDLSPDAVTILVSTQRRLRKKCHVCGKVGRHNPKTCQPQAGPPAKAESKPVKGNTQQQKKKPPVGGDVVIHGHDGKEKTLSKN